MIQAAARSRKVSPKIARGQIRPDIKTRPPRASIGEKRCVKRRLALKSCEERTVPNLLTLLKRWSSEACPIGVRGVGISNLPVPTNLVLLQKGDDHGKSFRTC